MSNQRHETKVAFTEKKKKRNISKGNSLHKGTVTEVRSRHFDREGPYHICGILNM